MDVSFPFSEFSSNTLYKETNEEYEGYDGECCRGIKIVITVSKIAGCCLRQRSKAKETVSGNVYLCLALSKCEADVRKDITYKQYDAKRKKKSRDVMRPRDKSIHTTKLLPFYSPLLKFSGELATPTDQYTLRYCVAAANAHIGIYLFFH